MESPNKCLAGGTAWWLPVMALVKYLGLVCGVHGVVQGSPLPVLGGCVLYVFGEGASSFAGHLLSADRFAMLEDTLRSKDP